MDFSKVLWRFEKLPDLEYLDVSNNKLIGDAAPQVFFFFKLKFEINLEKYFFILFIKRKIKQTNILKYK